MRRDIYLVILGLVIGIAVPNLARMANALLSGSWGVFVETLRIALLSFTIEAVIVCIIIILLRRQYKKDDQSHSDNTQKVIDAIDNLADEIRQDRNERNKL